MFSYCDILGRVGVLDGKIMACVLGLYNALRRAPKTLSVSA